MITLKAENFGPTLTRIQDKTKCRRYPVVAVQQSNSNPLGFQRFSDFGSNCCLRSSVDASAVSDRKKRQIGNSFSN
jgi:hypothetical protein